MVVEQGQDYPRFSANHSINLTYSSITVPEVRDRPAIQHIIHSLRLLDPTCRRLTPFATKPRRSALPGNALLANFIPLPRSTLVYTVTTCIVV